MFGSRIGLPVPPSAASRAGRLTVAIASHHVWVDDRLRSADGPHLNVADRGFQLGDGVFETLRSRSGHVFELSAHLVRLRRSAGGLDIHLPADAEDRIARGILALLAVDDLDGSMVDASIRVTVSRGVVPGRGLLPPMEGVPPTIAIQAWPIAPPPAGHLETGLHLATSAIRRDPENPLVHLKTTSRADSVHARLEARHAGADDALFLTLDGYLSEATTANVVLVRGDEIATPSLACAILDGTTRTWILEWAARSGFRVLEGLLTAGDLAEADEAFLCSSVAGILPVTRCDGRPIGTGRPGPVTLRARAEREASIRDEAGG